MKHEIYRAPECNSFFYMMQTLAVDRQDAPDMARRGWSEEFGEEIRVGEIPYEALKFDMDGEITNDISQYFKQKMYQIPAKKIKLKDIDIGASNPGAWENYAKMVWLSNEFLKAGKRFAYPICAHWNPRLQISPIHPGGCRNKVFKIWGEPGDTVASYYFNTRGFDSNWWQEMKPISVDEIIEQGHEIGLSPDHGTLIPHVMQQLHSIKVGKKQHQQDMYTKFVKDGVGILTNNTSLLPEWLHHLMNNKSAKRILNIKFDDNIETLTEHEIQQIGMLVGMTRAMDLKRIKVSLING